MRVLVYLTFLLTSMPAWALNAHEMPESAHTVGDGAAQVHLGLGQSSFGLTDNLDLRTRIAGQFFGFNAQLKWAIVQDENKALSFEPLVWAEWPWATMGFPSYSAGAMLRHSMRVGEKGRLNLGVGGIYDHLKVTFQFSDEFDPRRGFGGDWWYSLTLTRAPMAFGHSVVDIQENDFNPGWIFHGVRVPVVLGYEHMVSEKSSFNTVARLHPLNFVNGGSWYAEVHPTFVTRMGENARIALGMNVIMPGNPMPIADDELEQSVEDQASNLHIRAWEAWVPELPFLPLPYFGAYWVF
jgi:hypothetical protein